MNITNAINYKGTVTVKLQNKKTVRRNTATKHMFELLLRVLGRQQFTSQSTPLYITILDNKEAGQTGGELSVTKVIEAPTYSNYKQECILNRLLLATPTVQFDKEPYSLTFLTTFDVSSLTSTQGFSNADKDGIVCLVDGHQQSILAVTTIDRIIIADLASNPSHQAVIEWKIELTSIEPKTDTEEET